MVPMAAAARVFTLIATVVRVVCSIIAALIVVHAVFVLFEANPNNLLGQFPTPWRRHPPSRDLRSRPAPPACSPPRGPVWDWGLPPLPVLSPPSSLFGSASNSTK